MNFLLQFVASSFFRSRVLTRWVLGLDLGRLGKEDHYCDIVTLVLLQKVSKELSPPTRVLDMGTGAVAVIGLSLWKQTGCRVTAADINPQIVALARENIARHEAPIRVICSSFFEKVDEPFDVVIFDPPYVTTKAGRDAHLPGKRRSQWDGGSDGAEVIDNFIDALKVLNHNVKAYLGVNHWHVSRDRVLRALEGLQEAISIDEIYRHPLFPVDVYVLSRHV